MRIRQSETGGAGVVGGVSSEIVALAVTRKSQLELHNTSAGLSRTVLGVCDRSVMSLCE